VASDRSILQKIGAAAGAEEGHDLKEVMGLVVLLSMAEMVLESMPSLVWTQLDLHL
jgi:hypothetical protein